MKLLSTLFLAIFLLSPGQTPEPQKKPVEKSEPGSKQAKEKKKPHSFPGLQPRTKIRRKAPNLLPGVWQLNRISTQIPGARVKGYLVLTRLFASFHIMVQTQGQEPTSQTGIWRYLRQGNQLTFTRMMEAGRHPGGKQKRQDLKNKEIRRFRLIGNNLHLTKPNGVVLYFSRLE